MTDKLSDLLTRLTKATEGSRELDEAIWKELIDNDVEPFECFTTNPYAAMGLVEDLGYGWSIDGSALFDTPSIELWNADGESVAEVERNDIALGLCIVLVRAIQAKGGADDAVG